MDFSLLGGSPCPRNGPPTAARPQNHPHPPRTTNPGEPAASGKVAVAGALSRPGGTRPGAEANVFRGPTAPGIAAGTPGRGPPGGSFALTPPALFPPGAPEIRSPPGPPRVHIGCSRTPRAVADQAQAVRHLLPIRGLRIPLKAVSLDQVARCLPAILGYALTTETLNGSPEFLLPGLEKPEDLFDQPYPGAATPNAANATLNIKVGLPKILAAEIRGGHAKLQTRGAQNRTKKKGTSATPEALLSVPSFIQTRGTCAPERSGAY